jgi:HPt (histidine-containing phosphotransfer) domain-containing protein
MIDVGRIEELKLEIGEDDFADVLEIFIEEIESALDAMDISAPPSTIAAELHSLKGSAQNIGFSAFAEICVGAEALGLTLDLHDRLVVAFRESKRLVYADGPTVI